MRKPSNIDCFPISEMTWLSSSSFDATKNIFDIGLE